MIGGKLDRLITILNYTNVQTDTGAVQKVWSEYVTNLPCRYDASSGGTGVESNQRVESDVVTFTIRYPHSFTVTPSMHVLYDGIVGKILSVDENPRAGRRTELNIKCDFKDNYTLVTMTPTRLLFEIYQTGLGLTTAQKTKYLELFEALNNSGFLFELDRLHVYAGLTEAASKKSLVGSYEAVLHTISTWTIGDGFTQVANGYIDTGFTPSNGTKFTASDAGFGIIWENKPNADGYVFGVLDNTVNQQDFMQFIPSAGLGSNNALVSLNSTTQVGLTNPDITYTEDLIYATRSNTSVTIGVGSNTQTGTSAVGTRVSGFTSVDGALRNRGFAVVPTITSGNIVASWHGSSQLDGLELQGIIDAWRATI